MALAKRVIPCLDVTAGRVVKGVNFVGLRDAGDPVEIAPATTSRVPTSYVPRHHGEQRRARSDPPHRRSVAAQVFIPLTVGGGVRSVEDVRRLLNAGADKVSINTAAVQNPQLVADAAGRTARNTSSSRSTRSGLPIRGDPLGGFYPWRPARDRNRRASNGAEGCRRTARARSS